MALCKNNYSNANELIFQSWICSSYYIFIQFNGDILKQEYECVLTFIELDF